MKYKNLLALVMVTSLVSIGVSACSDDNNNDVHGGGYHVQANPDNSSNSNSTNDLDNSQTQDQGQDQSQDQDQRITT